MKRSKDGLVSKVLKFNVKDLPRDQYSRYVPYCDFEKHRGYIQDEKVCMKRNCIHYQRLYV